uniref:Uncharacterized protein n=1 Tax=Cacopsylla melanoneura TaxID=428564 RepID=A0A8D8XN99_9HEMI
MPAGELTFKWTYNCPQHTYSSLTNTCMSLSTTGLLRTYSCGPLLLLRLSLGPKISMSIITMSSLDVNLKIQIQTKTLKRRMGEGEACSIQPTTIGLESRDSHRKTSSKVRVR